MPDDVKTIDGKKFWVFNQKCYTCSATVVQVISGEIGMYICPDCNKMVYTDAMGKVVYSINTL